MNILGHEAPTIPFMPPDLNVPEAELVEQFAEIKNGFLYKYHLHQMPGKLNIALPNLNPGENIVNNFFWKGVQKHVIITDEGRLFEVIKTGNGEYGSLLLADLTDLGAYSVTKTQLTVGSFKHEHLIRTKQLDAMVLAYNRYDGGNGGLYKVGENDGVLSYTLHNFPNSQSKALCMCPVRYGATDNVLVVCENLKLYRFNYAVNTWDVIYDLTGLGANTAFFIVQPDDLQDLAYVVVGRAGLAPAVLKIDTNLLSGSLEAAVAGASSGDFIYSCDFLPHPTPAAVSFIMYMGLKNNVISYFADFPNDPGDPHTTGTDNSFYNSNAAVYCSTIKRTYDDKLIFGFKGFGNPDVDVVEGSISVDTSTAPDTYSITFDSLGSPYVSYIAYGSWKVLAGGVNYYYVGTPQGIFVRRGQTSFKKIVLEYSGSVLFDQYSLKNITGITHSTGKKGLLFVQHLTYSEPVYTVYMDSLQAVEAFDFEFGPGSVEIQETGKHKIDPTDGTEEAREFLTFCMFGRLFYYKDGGGTGQVTNFWKEDGSGWETTEIPPIASHAYMNGIMIIALEDTDEFYWSIPGEIFHILLTLYEKADHTPSNITKLSARWDILFIRSREDVEVWAHVQATNYVNLLQRTRVLGFGSQAPNSFVMLPGSVAWLIDERVFVESDGSSVIQIPNPLQKEFFSFDDISSMNCVYTVIEQHKFVFVTVADENKTWVYDVSNLAFYEWEDIAIVSACYDPRVGECYAVIDQELFLLSTELSNDDGTAFTVKLRTGFLSFNSTLTKQVWGVIIGLSKEAEDPGDPVVNLRLRFRDVDDDSAWSDYYDIPMPEDGEFTIDQQQLGIFVKRQYEIEYTTKKRCTLLLLQHVHDYLGEA